MMQWPLNLRFFILLCGTYCNFFPSSFFPWIHLLFFRSLSLLLIITLVDLFFRIREESIFHIFIFFSVMEPQDVTEPFSKDPR
jgi:hypothetical protein